MEKKLRFVLEIVINAFLFAFASCVVQIDKNYLPSKMSPFFYMIIVDDKNLKNVLKKITVLHRININLLKIISV